MHLSARKKNFDNRRQLKFYAITHTVHFKGTKMGAKAPVPANKLPAPTHATGAFAKPPRFLYAASAETGRMAEVSLHRIRPI